MEIEAIKTDNAPAAIGPYSQGISAGKWLFISGQLGINPETGELVGATLDAQARQAMQNLQQIVQAGGYKLSQVVAVDVFLTDMSQFSTFNEIYQEFFSEHKPARAVVEVRALPKNGAIEVKCVVCGG